jgi:hypothetical protein
MRIYGRISKAEQPEDALLDINKTGAAVEKFPPAKME